ncbi:MAG: lipid A biosynthesis acyltransferase [Bacteroidetes bacterium]|nr:MAG: lipid A biosynthesis acyltransferase [Bacteroidota bacterium]
MQSWKGSTRGGLWGYKIFILSLRFLGLGFAYFILAFIVVYFAAFAPKATRSIYYYFRTIRKQSAFQAFINIFRNYYVFGQVILDKIALLANFNTNFTYDFDGEHYLHELAKRKQGALLIGAHVGNWEIAGQLIERIDTKFHIVMLEAEHENIKKLMDNVLVRKDVNIIAIKNDMSHLQKIKEAFENNHFVAMHGDRFMDGAKSISCKFYGKQAYFPTGPFYTATKFKVPIVVVSAMKQSRRHYHFHATEPKLYPHTANPRKRNEQMRIIIRDYISEISDMLDQYPLQWFNYYEFWEEQKKKKDK